jgi:hypothetical protein
MICSWIWTSTHPASYKVCTIVSQLRISSTQDKWITDSQVAGPCCARANCFKFAGIWRGRDVWVQSEWSQLPVSLIHQTVKLIHLRSINIRTRDRARYSAKAHWANDCNALRMSNSMQKWPDQAWPGSPTQGNL